MTPGKVVVHAPQEGEIGDHRVRAIDLARQCEIGPRNTGGREASADHPGRRIAVPVVSTIGDRSDCGFDQLPAAPVFERLSQRLGDEAAASARSDALVEFRDEFILQLAERGVGTSVHFIPLYRFSGYQRFFDDRAAFPASEWVFERSVSLPIFPGMSEAEMGHVVDSVRDILNRHRR